MFVRTILGDIAPRDLGVVYSHDHIFCTPPYWAEQKQDDLLLDDFAASQKEVEIFKSAGGTAIYDATAWDYGRDVSAVAKISQHTGIHIIATAGFNKHSVWSGTIPGQKSGSKISFAQWVEKTSVDEITQRIITEVSTGIDGTQYKGGVIKCGTGYNTIHPLEKKVMLAAAAAQKHTNAPLHTHTELGTLILEQIEIFKAEGVNIAHLFIAHVDRNPDPWVHIKAMEQGATLCFDGISRIKYHPENIRIQNIITLIKAGFEDQIVIGGDIARKTMFASYGLGGLGMGYILSSWKPRFIEEANNAGVDGHALAKKLFITNPARVFTFKT